MTQPEMTPEWCLRMAQLEHGHEIGAGMPDHPLRDAQPTMLMQLLNDQIKKEGRMSSFIIRAGLLHDILATLPQPDAEALRETVRVMGEQFAFYAREHTAAGKHEKAATNQRFANLAANVLNKDQPHDA